MPCNSDYYVNISKILGFFLELKKNHILIIRSADTFLYLSLVPEIGVAMATKKITIAMVT